MHLSCIDGWFTDEAELDQADEEELVAISFAGLYDLERGRCAFSICGLS